MIAAVAAGHPATAEAGVEILAAGGNAADAAVAASLASCVAETVMTGLLGGGHAIYFDAATGEVRNLDCFVAVPSGDGEPMSQLAVPGEGCPLRHRCLLVRRAGLPAGLRAVARTGGCRGRRSSSRHSSSRAPVSRCRRRWPRAWRCSHR
jgi:gamma-glutamyltranspeptidase/glutathione hydrolase